MAFVPNQSHLVAMLFLLTGGVLGLLGVVWVYALAAGKGKLARRVLFLAASCTGLYLGVLLGVSWASDERTLGPGEQKYFCELDCHLAYSVGDVLMAKTLGSGERQATAQGTFYVVKLKTHFDEKTISSRRPKEALLWPNLRWEAVVDEQGRRYTTSLAGLKALEAPAGENVPLTQSLRPGESYETILVFDLPADARNPRLLLTDPFPVNLVLIGHENSFLHKKVFFRLEPHSAALAAN